MQFKSGFLLKLAFFALVLLVFASSSSAFNTFRSSEDEVRLSNEYVNLMREIKSLNEQILEQAKITNKLLQGKENEQSGNSAASTNTSKPLIRANP